MKSNDPNKIKLILNENLNINVSEHLYFPDN